MIYIITFLYVLIALLVFGLLIFIHELGHFLSARACGVGVKEFAIGMGPKLLSWKSKKYDTVYRLRLLPIGGFVSMVGEDDESSESNAFCNQKVWKRICIVVAGPIMNILLGFLLMLILVIGQGNLYGTTVKQFSENALSSQKLAINDQIIKIGNTKVFTANDVVYEIMNQGYKPIDVTVIRDNNKIVVNDVSFPVINDKGVELGVYDFYMAQEENTFANYLKHSYYRSLSTVKMVIDSIFDLFGGRYGLEAVSGPIGVTEVIVEAAQSSFFTLLYVVIVISINLGVFNLIPFPVLDGGRLLFLIIEGITRKPVKKEIENFINFAGMMILFAFMAFIIVKDVFGLFK